MMFKSPKLAYEWARKHGPSYDARKSVLKDPKWTYLYAFHVDGHPRDDTRAATLKSPEYAYWYAHDIDGYPRDDTRQAVLSDPIWTIAYAIAVDKEYREDTFRVALKDPEAAYYYASELEVKNDAVRKAVLKSPKWTYKYIKDVEGGIIYPEAAKTMRQFLLAGDEWAVKMFKEFEVEK